MLESLVRKDLVDYRKMQGEIAGLVIYEIQPKRFVLLQDKDKYFFRVFNDIKQYIFFREEEAKRSYGC